MTFGTGKWWGRQPHAPAAFTPRNIPGTHPGTVRLVAQRLNHYATPGASLNSSLYNCTHGAGSGSHYIMSHGLFSNVRGGAHTDINSATPILLNKQSQTAEMGGPSTCALGGDW